MQFNCCVCFRPAAAAPPTRKKTSVKVQSGEMCVPEFTIRRISSTYMKKKVPFHPNHSQLQPGLYDFMHKKHR